MTLNRVYAVPPGKQVRCRECGELAEAVEGAPIGATAALFLLKPCGHMCRSFLLEDVPAGRPGVIDTTAREKL